MTNAEYYASVKDDSTNLRGGRNVRNTPTTAYNCGGFALNTFTWVTPYADDESDDAWNEDARERDMIEMYEEDAPIEDILEVITAYDTDYLLRHYDFLEEAYEEEIKPEDTIIAYRIFIHFDEEYGIVDDTDFHFLKRINSFWFEKMGTEPVSISDLPDPADEWEYRDRSITYDGPIKYFRIKRKETIDESLL